MTENEIRKANRKTMPKYILIMIICVAAGAIVGVAIAKSDVQQLSGSVKNAGEVFERYVAPGLIVAAAVILPAVFAVRYRKAKQLLSAWDGENEEAADAVERELSVLLWFTNTALIVTLFFFSAFFSGLFRSREDNHGAAPVLFIITVAAFFAVLIEVIFMQQKCVDAIKLTNPEKTASVYDPKFESKWLDSCDEAERLMAGKCAFRAYRTANSACAVLTVILAVSALCFGTGFLPCLAVCLIWLIMQASYYQGSMRSSDSGSKVS